MSKIQKFGGQFSTVCAPEVQTGRRRLQHPPKSFGSGKTQSQSCFFLHDSEGGEAAIEINKNDSKCWETQRVAVGVDAGPASSMVEGERTRERERGREARDSLIHSVSARPAPCWTARRTEFQAADRCPQSAGKSLHAPLTGC